MKLTEEQEQVIEEVLNNHSNKIITVNSVAGSGKTSVSKAIVEAVRPKNGFYTAFNKAIIEDSKNKFNNLIECKTVHSLAYSYIKPRRIGEFYYSSITEKIPYTTKADIFNTLDDFFRSKYVDIYQYVIDNNCSKLVSELVCKYAEMMLEDKIAPTFNFLLKCLHILLYNKEISIDKDLLILDEAQDSTNVTLEIFKLINCNKKVVLGDKFQNIYSFMNTINAFEELEDTIELHLTKSFRCNPTIANKVEVFGKRYLDTKFKYSGNPDIDIPLDSNNTICYLSRCNSSLIQRIYDLLNKDVSFKLTKPMREIFELPLAIYDVNQGKSTTVKKYSFLNTEYRKYSYNKLLYEDFYDYLAVEVKDSNINTNARVLKELTSKGINIYSVYNRASSLKKKNSNIILSTVHAYKGLESDIVILEDDINRIVGKIIDKIKLELLDGEKTLKEIRKSLTKDEKENLNTYYVALSRARMLLKNARY